jgi:5-hydroxyisourate hydrolase
MGRLTTHVLDTMHGCPAAGMGVKLYVKKGSHWESIFESHTNQDGRMDRPLLEGEQLAAGSYMLEFSVLDYFHGKKVAQKIGFLDVIPIRFSILSNDEHYHVPLLVSPWSYSTYRGS